MEGDESGTVRDDEDIVVLPGPSSLECKFGYSSVSRNKRSMDNIKAMIETVLPNLPMEKINAVITTLDELGVVEEEDLKYVEEKDFTNILKPIPARKLIKAWNQKVFVRVPNKMHMRMVKYNARAPERNAAPLRPILPQSNVSSSEVAASSTTTVIPLENEPSTSQQTPQTNSNSTGIFPMPTVLPLENDSSTSEQSFQGNSARIFPMPTVLPLENDASTSEQSFRGNSAGIFSMPTVIHLKNQTSLNQLPLQVNQADTFILSTPMHIENQPSVCHQPLPANWADTFSIPWHKMPSELMCALSEGRRPKPSCRREMVRIICHEVQRMCNKPGKKNLSVIARKVVARYPASLADTFCGEDTLGDGSASFLRQLELRFENMNRGKTFSVLKRNLQARQLGDMESSQIKKLRISDQYGCVNWQPTTLPIHETEMSQSEKKEKMKVLSQNWPQSFDSSVIGLLNSTYYSQRRDINSGCEIKHLLSEWPLLFKKEGLLNHFLTLVGVDIVQKLNSAFSDKGNRIVGYLKSKPRTSKQSKLQETLEELEEEDLLEECAIGINPVVVILIIMAYFGESSESLFICVDLSFTPSDVEQLTSLPSTPCLIVCGKKLHAGISYMLCIEKKVVNDKLASFQDGLAMLFASFYCFNIKYPAGAATTLEFIQRCFLNINPDRGSKVNALSRKRCTYNPRILALLNGVTDFEWSFQ